MHSFVSPIVLGMGRPAERNPDTKRSPPSRQTTQPTRRGRAREGRTIVDADGGRQTVAFKKPLEDGLYYFGSHGRQHLQAEHKAAERVAHGERLVTSAVAGPPPALEIHRPDIIRRFDLEGLMCSQNNP